MSDAELELVNDVARYLGLTLGAALLVGLLTAAVIYREKLP